MFGAARHLQLANVGTQGVTWPVPFDISEIFRHRGRPTVVLASGDPFFFGVGTRLVEVLSPNEWQAFPSLSTFSLVASKLGWPLEHVQCLGLHGRDRRDSSDPLMVETSRVFGELFPHLQPQNRLICLLRDAAAVTALGGWLTEQGFGESNVWLMEAMGGPRQRVEEQKANCLQLDATTHLPLSLAIELVGADGFSMVPGRPETAFYHDGQISKATIRALTVSALTPKPHDRLWDIGAGSGAVAIEWCLAGGGQAVALERQPKRAHNIHKNLVRYGLQTRIEVRVGDARTHLASLPSPESIFIGGGMNEDLFRQLKTHLKSTTRMVINAVSIETEMLLMHLQREYGGEIYHFAHAALEPLGGKHGWSPARPIVQWRSHIRG